MGGYLGKEVFFATSLSVSAVKVKIFAGFPTQLLYPILSVPSNLAAVTTLKVFWIPLHLFKYAKLQTPSQHKQRYFMHKISKRKLQMDERWDPNTSPILGPAYDW